jgi:Ca-activated chloride channel family protein
MTAILYLLYAMRTHLAIVAVLTLAVGAFAQDVGRPISVDVSLVTVGVEVVDSNDRPVTTLTRNDFEIYENGIRQELRSFDSIDTPYSILLLFDCSSSTEPDWPFLVQAMNRFTQTLRPQDRIEVAQFGTGFKVIQRWFSRTDTSVNIALQTLDSTCFGTDFYGALRKGIEELKLVKGRRGMVILTDGAHQDIPHQTGKSDSFSFTRFVDAVGDSDFQKALKTAASSAAMLYFVAVNTDLNPDGVVGANGDRGSYDPEEIYNMQQIRSRMEQLASVSGGRVAFPKVPEDVIGLYERMAQELGSSYSLGYTPKDSKDGTYRKIEVRLRDRSLRLRQSRDEYVAR